MYRISATLRQQVWDTKLRQESKLHDILSDVEGSYNAEKRAFPKDSVIAKVDLKGKRSQNIPFLKNLSGSGRTGRSTLVGHEVDQDTREVACYANELRHAVNTEQYGIDANEKAPYRLLEAVQPQLSLWLGEMKGKYARQALWQRYSENLTAAPISATQYLHENIFIKNIGMANLPAYSTTASTYVNNIGAALDTAGGSDNSLADVKMLTSLQYWVTTVKKLKPARNGRYILVLPARQCAFLKDPTRSDSVAGLYLNSHLQDQAQTGVNQYVKSFGMFDIYEDGRSPLVQLTGSAGAYSMSSFYKGAGDDDDRAGVTGNIWDVGFVLGEGSLLHGVYEEAHFEEEPQDYNYVKGIGIAAGFGYTRVAWYDSLTSETAAKTINDRSAAVMMFAGGMTT